MSKRVCLFTGSFNPPGLHHLEAVRQLAAHFDEVRIVASGFRADKPSNNAIPATIRATLIDLAFQDQAGVVVDHFDLENQSYTPNRQLDRRYGDAAKVFHAVSAAMVRRGQRGESLIHRTWPEGAEAWQQLQFVVYKTPAMQLDEADLPPRCQLIDVPREGSSQSIRRRLYEGDQCTDQLAPRVRDYIERYGLYRFSDVQHEGRIDVSQARFLVVVDQRNDRALEIQRRMSGITTDEDPDAILVIGGDGTMLHAIHSHWQLRRPFFGLNAGHLGFLMNEGQDVLDDTGRICQTLIVRRLPMLQLEFHKQSGEVLRGFSFNDAWIERSSGQTAWLNVRVDGETKIEKVVCDGVLVSTAAGSTAYAMSMGASPLLADTPAWLVVGSNVMRPLGWKSAVLPMTATVEVTGLHTEKRPLNGYLWGQLVDNVTQMSAHISRVASVELAFSPDHDMARKISDLQFNAGKDI